MRVCVTGAAGFIGSHVCDRLINEGHQVRGIDDLSTGHLDNLDDSGDVDLIEGSILDATALTAAVRDVDAVVHLAALPSVPRSVADPVASHEANTVGTMRVLEAARALDDASVIVASSSSVYGANPTLPKHEALCPAPMSPYAASKLATEQYALAWQHSYGLRTLAVRFFNVYGPRQRPGHAYAAAIPAFADAALRGRRPRVFGDGQQSRDFTYVETVAEVLADAVNRRLSHPQPINLAYGSQTTLLELIAMLEELLATSLQPEHLDERVGDVRHSRADASAVRSLFPTIEPTALDVGLRATVEWMAPLLDREDRA
ncbi:MAG: NAD-dependent epimerase/dehydratase family protein [Actinomycetota bacterium]